MKPEEIRALLEQNGGSAADTDYGVSGTHVDVTVDAATLRTAVQVLREREFLLEHLTAVDTSPEMMVVYQFHTLEGGCRVTLRALTDRQAPEMPSVHDIYPGANWHEREAHDFFGLVFSGHPDLSPLLLPEDAGDLCPLRKSDDRLKPLGEVMPRFATVSPPEGDTPPSPKSEGKA